MTILLQQIKELQQELLHLKNKLHPVADTMQNFALESQGNSSLSSSSSSFVHSSVLVLKECVRLCVGASILHHLTSESLLSPLHTVTLWGIPLWFQPTSPRIVIQAHFMPLTPGRCWAFKGTRGQLFIALSHPIRITYVTLGHISSMQSPTGFPSSAPKMFSVYVSRTAIHFITLYTYITWCSAAPLSATDRDCRQQMVKQSI